VNEPTKTEVDAEDWLKATALELCKVADHFIALRKDAEQVDAAAVELIDSTAKLEQENVDLRARVKRLEDALAAADKYIDEIQSDDPDYDTWICNTADAHTAYIFAKQAAKESKP
jgi:predicted  nucleic acid-binding Zn-ribbon protein